jgi:hypothetical protein
MNRTTAIALMIILGAGCRKINPAASEAEPAKSTDNSPVASTDDGRLEATDSVIDKTDTATDSDSESVTTTAQQDTGTHTDTAQDTAATTDRAFDSDPPMNTDSASHTGFDTETALCQCPENQRCNEETGLCECKTGYIDEACTICDAKSGYVEWPEGSTRCIIDPCADWSCNGRGACAIGTNDLAVCDCVDDWKGRQCNLKITAMSLPGVLQALAFDLAGNPWLATDRGLIAYDLNATPDDPSDDTCQLFTSSDDAYIHDIQDIAISPDGLTWMGTRGVLSVFDDRQTPSDKGDDAWYHLATRANTYEHLTMVKTDDQGRVWVRFNEPGNGVDMLDNPLLEDGDDPNWLRLFDGQDILDIAVAGDGVWIASDAGLAYVHLGPDAHAPSEDRRIDFSSMTPVTDRNTVRIVIDRLGNKLFYADGAIAQLNDNGDPFDTSGHTWRKWRPEDEPNGPKVTAFVGIGPDNSKWFVSAVNTLWRFGDTEMGGNAWTEYHPHRCLLSSDTHHADETVSSTSSVVIDAHGNTWVTAMGNLYYLDSNDTPVDPMDDTWSITAWSHLTFSGFSKMTADPDSGLWGLLSYSPPVPHSYHHDLYYFQMADPLDPSDDTWVGFGAEEGFPGSACALPYGIDSANRRWFFTCAGAMTHYFNIDILDNNGTLLDKNDDTWIDYPDIDLTFNPAPYLATEPAGGFWLSGYYLDTAGTPENFDDDTWVVVDDFQARTGAVDAMGGKWFGYHQSDYMNADLEGPLRYLDDGATPGDVSDDRWTTFTTEEGLLTDRVDTIRIDAVGTKWFACGASAMFTGGLCRLDDNGTPRDTTDDELLIFNALDGLPSNTIHDIAIDEDRALWVSTDGGLAYLQFKQ